MAARAVLLLSFRETSRDSFLYFPLDCLQTLFLFGEASPSIFVDSHPSQSVRRHQVSSFRYNRLSSRLRRFWQSCRCHANWSFRLALKFSTSRPLFLAVSGDKIFIQYTPHVCALYLTLVLCTVRYVFNIERPSTLWNPYLMVAYWCISTIHIHHHPHRNIGTGAIASRSITISFCFDCIRTPI